MVDSDCLSLSPQTGRDIISSSEPLGVVLKTHLRVALLLSDFCRARSPCAVAAYGDHDGSFATYVIHFPPGTAQEEIFLRIQSESQ